MLMPKTQTAHPCEELYKQILRCPSPATKRGTGFIDRVPSNSSSASMRRENTGRSETEMAIGKIGPSMLTSYSAFNQRIEVAGTI
jgi:hypothetical protein